MVDIRLLEKLLKALANRRRLEIVKYLKIHHKASVGDIARGIKLSFAATSRHLNILESSGILNKQQVGLVVFYSLSSHGERFEREVVALL